MKDDDTNKDDDFELFRYLGKLSPSEKREIEREKREKLMLKFTILGAISGVAGVAVAVYVWLSK